MARRGLDGYKRAQTIPQGIIWSRLCFTRDIVWARPDYTQIYSRKTGCSDEG